HSEELQQAENRLEQARLDRQIAATAALPKIEGSATGAYMLPDMDMMGMDLRMRGTYMAGLNLTQSIYAGGKIAAARRMARIGEEVAGGTAADDPHGCAGRSRQHLLDHGGC
ncbi:hypothetical protein LEA_15386, partial [human gut metagenome]